MIVLIHTSSGSVRHTCKHTDWTNGCTIVNMSHPFVEGSNTFFWVFNRLSALSPLITVVAGIHASLQYIDSVGVNTLDLPPFRLVNSSLHGQWLGSGAPPFLIHGWLIVLRSYCVTQPGFTLLRRQFVTLNRLRCGQARCAESLHRWGVIASPACPCGESHQTTRHIVEECPLTTFPGGLQRLHQAGPDAVEWLSRLSLKL